MVCGSISIVFLIRADCAKLAKNTAIYRFSRLSAVHKHHITSCRKAEQGHIGPG